MFKFGFLIRNGKIYDTKIQSYTLNKEYVGENIIYSMNPSDYKRLYAFEPLLDYYPLEMVFALLNFNSFIRKEREDKRLIKTNNLHYISNMSRIYNYPPTYLTQRKFSLYKICQRLKKRID